MLWIRRWRFYEGRGWPRVPGRAGSARLHPRMCPLLQVSISLSRRPHRKGMASCPLKASSLRTNPVLNSRKKLPHGLAPIYLFYLIPCYSPPVFFLFLPIPSSFPSQGPCTCGSLCLNYPPHCVHGLGSVYSLGLEHRCHLLREVIFKCPVSPRH